MLGYLSNHKRQCFVLIADIFGISDHDLMYSQEAVETPDELAEAVPDKQAIEARVRVCVCLKPGENDLREAFPIHGSSSNDNFFISIFNFHSIAELF